MAHSSVAEPATDNRFTAVRFSLCLPKMRRSSPVERRCYIPRAAGSIPAAATKWGRALECSKLLQSLRDQCDPDAATNIWRCLLVVGNPTVYRIIRVRFPSAPPLRSTECCGLCRACFEREHVEPEPPHQV